MTSPEYLTRIEPVAKILADDGSAYFTGAVAALRLWAEDGAAALGFNTTCSEASSFGGLVACFDFNRSLDDSLLASNLRLRAGDKYQDWCQIVDDGGHFIYNPYPLTGKVSIYQNAEANVQILV